MKRMVSRRQYEAVGKEMTKLLNLTNEMMGYFLHSCRNPKRLHLCEAGLLQKRESVVLREHRPDRQAVHG